MIASDVIAALAATEPSEPRIELLGIELTGAAAWAAFVVSLISIGEALVALIRWIWRLLIPIQLEAFFWTPGIESGAPEVAQLKVNIHNGNKDPKNLNRLEVWYDPGWWKRRVPLWHLKKPSPKPSIDRGENDLRSRPIGWSSVYPVVECEDREHEPLIVVAGFSRKRVRTTRVRKLETSIYVPPGEGPAKV